MTISVRRRTLIPEGETVPTKILEAKQVSGQYSPQLRLDLKVIAGKYKGERFTDWSKLAVDEETDQPYIADNTKAWEIIVAAFGGDEKKAEKFKDPKELEGKVIMAQTCIRGKATKRNGLQFGTIFPYRDAEAETEAELDELPNDEDDKDDEEE